ncbi:MAG: putative Ig domain-containing protein, partial [Campylobacterota bacterium]|nr:putative Ig domain-containing protein [Campylobacterota bacterium]
MKQNHNYIYKILLLFMLMIVPQSLVAASLSPSSVAPSTITTDDNYNITFTVDDKNYDDWSVTGLPSDISFSVSGESCTISGTPSQTGTFDITVKAAKNFAQSTIVSYELKVEAPVAPNQSPTITPIGGLTAVVGKYFEYQVVASDPDNDSLTYGTYYLPNDLSIYPSTGLISGIPSNISNDPQTHTITVIDKAGKNQTVTEDFTLNIINNAPTFIEPIPPIEATVGEYFEYQIKATDSDGHTLNYINHWMPELSMSSSGLISGTPSGTTNSEVEVTVTDNYGGEIKQKFTLSVVEAQAGTPPQVDAIIATKEVSVGVGFNLDLTVHVTKTEDDNITQYTLTNVPSGASFDTVTGMLSGTLNSIEDFTNLALSATDKDGTSNATTFTLSVVEAQAGTPPQVDAIIATKEVSVGVGFNLDLTVHVTKTEDDNITQYTLTNVPSGASFDTATGMLSGTLNSIEDFTNLALSATDKDGISNATTFTLSVVEQGMPPLVTPVPEQTIPLDENFSIDFSTYVDATDGDPILSYSLSGISLPSSVEFNTTTGILSGKYTDTSEYPTVELRAKDKDGESNASIFKVLVVSDTNITYVETADDLCYDTVETSGMCMGMMSLMCTVTTPIRNLSDLLLSDVKILFEDSSNLNFSAFADCGVDGSSLQDVGGCLTNSLMSGGPFTMFSEGLLFDTVPDYTAKDTHSVYSTVMFEFAMFSDETLKGSYQKDGVYYRGVLKACQEDESNATLDDETIPDDSAEVIEGSCDVFADGLQTRAVDSRVDFSGGSGALYNNPDKTLNTYGTPLNGDSANANSCKDTAGTSGDDGSCAPSGIGATEVADPLGGMKYPATFALSRPVSSASTSKEYNDNQWSSGATQTGTVLTESSYDKISSVWNDSWDPTVIPFRVPVTLSVNTIENGSKAALVSFESATGGAYQFSIDVIKTKENGVFATQDLLAKNIKIGTISSDGDTTQGSAHVNMSFTATQTIKIEQLNTGHSSNYTLKAPYVNINRLKDVSGIGQTN